MRKLKIALGIFSGLLLCLVSAAVLWLRSGPTGPVPTGDPIVRLNREHADSEDNAAELYREAFAALQGEPRREWSGKDGWQRGEPVPEDAAKWVADNSEAIGKGLEAAQRENCWFQLRRRDGLPSSVEVVQTRTLAKLFAWRARVAAEQRDLATFAESVWVADRIGGHVSQCPWTIAQLVGLACHSIGQTEILQPYTWPNLSVEERAAYYERVASCYVPPPPLTAAFSFQQEWAAWEMPSTLSGHPFVFLFFPSERISGEFGRYFNPLASLAELPVECQANPADPLRREIRKLENESISRFNVPRMLASILLPSELRAIELRVRMITTQRGNHTVAELFGIRDRTGAFPETLDELAGDFRIDPYTGQPFFYRLADDGFVLYSAGVDRDDDGGRHHHRFGEERDAAPDGDYVFWPLQADR